MYTTSATSLGTHRAEHEYLTISRRRRDDYKPEPEATNCFTPVSDVYLFFCLM